MIPRLRFWSLTTCRATSFSQTSDAASPYAGQYSSSPTLYGTWYLQVFLTVMLANLRSLFSSVRQCVVSEKFISGSGSDFQVPGTVIPDPGQNQIFFKVHKIKRNLHIIQKCSELDCCTVFTTVTIDVTKCISPGNL